MMFNITGTLSTRDAWVVDYIDSYGPVSGVDEPALLDYAAAFDKPLVFARRLGRARCKPFEKKLINLWERGILVRDKRPSEYSDRKGVWYYGLSNKHPGEPFINTNGV